MFADLMASGALPQRLLSPGYTLVDQSLATHYRLAFGAADGKAVHRIESAQRGGLFSQGLFLTSTARGSEFKRVIDRGIWTLNRVLCRPLPMLPAATREQIAMSFSTIDPALPLPQKMALHRNREMVCHTCHSQMDPIGLALEKYDANAQWRDAYADGTPIQNDFDLDGVRVKDPAELAAAIERNREFHACVATKMLTYALNRNPNAAERVCLPESLALPIGAKAPSLKELAIKAFTTSLKLTGDAP
jgi:hypothetical protein